MKRTVLSILMLALSLGAIAAPPAPIKTKIPPRPKGATDMVNFRTASMDSVRVGFIGLGMRGPGAVYRWANIDRTSIKALCDKHPERLAKSQKYLQDAGRPAAAEYSGEEGWKQLCERPDIDIVYIATDWKNHVPMAVYAMEHGKHVAAGTSTATCLPCSTCLPWNTARTWLWKCPLP